MALNHITYHSPEPQQQQHTHDDDDNNKNNNDIKATNSSEKKRIAVIGAGISGIATAAHVLLQRDEQGRQLFQVTVFERSGHVGGVWQYDARRPLEPAYPNEVPPVANPLRRRPRASSSSSSSSQEQAQGGKAQHSRDKSVKNGRDTPESSQEEEEEFAMSEEDDEQDCDYEIAALKHAPPGPAYEGLKNNVPTSLMRSRLLDWPAGTDEYVGQEVMVQYIRDLAERTRAREKVVLNTSVENIWKREESDGDDDQGVFKGKWRVRTKTLHHPRDSSFPPPPSPPRDKGGEEKEEEQGRRRPLFTYKTQEFDAVVVASGHYHVPRIPDLPGLRKCKDAVPGCISHSKGYRSPAGFEGKRILIVGSSTSAHDIARELGPVADKVYVSSRGGLWDVDAPPPAVRVGEVLRLEVVVEPGNRQEEERSPGILVIHFKDHDHTRTTSPSNGTHGSSSVAVDHVILATGYLTSYPFLPSSMQDPRTSPEHAGDRAVVTRDGLLTHNLHRDIWYIPDPSLAFVGVVFHTSTFSMFDFQAAVVARVLAGKAELPRREEMWEEYNRRREGLFETGGGGGGTNNGMVLREQLLRTFHSLMDREAEYISEIQAWADAEAQRLGVEKMEGLDERWYRRYDELQRQLLANKAAQARAIADTGSTPTGNVLSGPLEREAEKKRKEKQLARDDGSGSRVEEADVLSTVKGREWARGDSEGIVLRGEIIIQAPEAVH